MGILGWFDLKSGHSCFLPKWADVAGSGAPKENRFLFCLSGSYPTCRLYVARDSVVCKGGLLAGLLLAGMVWCVVDR